MNKTGQQRKRPIALFLIFTMLLACFMEVIALAADPPLISPPQRYKVSDIGYIQNLNKKDWYANLAWDAVAFPPEATERYITLSFNEHETGTGLFIPDAIQVPLPGSGDPRTTITEFSPDTIKHGTIYESYARASYKIINPSGQYSVQSQKSNPIKFLTGLHVSVELIPGTNNIKIMWDDVWDRNGRISYRILISDTKGFTQPPPVPDIVASEIGKAGSPVIVNASQKKLEFTYAFAQPGREYAIKVVPLPDPAVSCATADEIDAVTIKTDILLKAQRVGFTNTGDIIWKLFWNPIVKGSTFTKVNYELYRYTNSDLTGQLYRLIPEKDSYQIIIPKNDTNIYSFRVDAKAYPPNSDNPVEFRSNARVSLKEQVAQQPEAPEFVDVFSQADPDLKYEDLLTSTTAAVMWKAPYTGEGMVDTDVTYDIYLVDDIKNISDTMASNYKIASDLSMTESNAIRHEVSGAIIGYRFDLVGLKSNANYYFVIYAKKNYLVQSPDTGFMVTKEHISRKAVKVIITRPDTGRDKPLAPPAPPFRLKTGGNGIDYTTATLLLEKNSYMLRNQVTGVWEIVNRNTYLLNENRPAGDPAKLESKAYQYNTGWRVIPHIVPYNDALMAVEMRQNRPSVYISYSDLTQADILAFQIEQEGTVIPNTPLDADNQTFEIPVTGLTHNTAYLTWITIENQNEESSYPSDPIVITTPPLIPETPVTPTVPTDLSGIAADDFIDLFWTVRLNMDYEIRCGTSDNIDSATITKQITNDEMKGKTLYRVSELTADTLYYFWIRAISTTLDGTRIESEFSNPLIIRTEAYKPPAPPAGFGVQSGADGVTENSIAYVWEAKPDFTYYLEFADNIDFNNSSEITVSGGSYRKTGLISNKRYYARLYAFENKTDLRSLPTGTIMVITNKSKNEYDASYDLDDIPGGDVLVISPTVKDGLWSAGSTGVNAHRMAEQVRALKAPVVQIDLSQPPPRATTIRLDLGSVLIDTLSERKMELYVRLPSADVIIRPDSLQNDEYFRLKGTDSNFSLRFEAVSPATGYKAPTDLKLVTPVTALKVGAANSVSPFKSFAKPLRVDMPVAGLSAYKAGQITTYRYDDASRAWSPLASATRYDTGRVSGELVKPGAFMAATRSVASVGTVPAYVTASLNSIQSVFKLNALGGKTFSAAAEVPQSDVVKLLLDVVPDTYTEDNFMDHAVKSGILKSYTEIQNGTARRDQAIALLVSFYRYKSREPALPENPTAWGSYTDLSSADPRYVNALKFAIENGISQGNGSTLMYPNKKVTYAEMIVMLEKVLKLLGEL